MTVTDNEIRERTTAVIDAVGLNASETAFRSALWDAG